MNTAYTDAQYETNYPPGVENHWWNRARSQLVLSIVRKTCESNSVFLEIGCGKGLEVKSLREAGIETWGVELAHVIPLEEVSEYVESGMDVVDLPAEQRNRITGILLLDVIEHLPDPENFLKILAPRFPNLSVVIVTVPACQELWSNYDVYYGHFRRYSLQMLQALAFAPNWRLGSFGYFFHLLYLPARVLALLGVDRQTEFRPPGARTRWLHKVVASINVLASRLLPGQLKGSSAFAVFQVPSRDNS